MVLRSSSTPVFGNLSSSFSDNPNSINKNKALTFIFRSVHNMKSFSCNSSPIHNSLSGSNRESKISSQNPIRRARSEGNLERLYLAPEPIDPIEFRSPETESKSGFRHYRPILRTEPSFSIFNDEFQNPDGDSSPESLQRTVTIGEVIEDLNGADFCFGKGKMGLIAEEDGEEEPEVWGIGEEVERVSTPPLCIASGLGVGADGFGLSMADFGERRDMEEYYKKMIGQCPFHPLFLRNYARLLQSKGDLYGAEGYYSRASLADPEDGEIWMQYGKLVWDLYHDQERALSYFKLATEVAPQDSNVLAAYASFLWNIGDDEEEDGGAPENNLQVEQKECVSDLNNSSPKKVAGGIRVDVCDAIANGPSHSGNLEEYYRKMIEENPNSPLFLRNYANFLSESKGDLQGAEEFYSRAILADPRDGEIMAQYAKLVWELHRDGQKTLAYFERAVQACPNNRHVLAAYASFLWDYGDEEEEEEDQVQVPLFQEGRMTAANV